MAKWLPILHIFAVTLNCFPLSPNLSSLSEPKGIRVRKLVKERRQILVNGGTTGERVGCWTRKFKYCSLYNPKYQALAPFKWLRNLGSLPSPSRSLPWERLQNPGATSSPCSSVAAPSWVTTLLVVSPLHSLSGHAHGHCWAQLWESWALWLQLHWFSAGHGCPAAILADWQA